MKSYKKQKRKIGITAVLMAAAVCIIILVTVFQKKVDSAVYEGGLYHYFGERRLDYPGSCRLLYREGEVVLEDQNGKHPMDTTPLYMENGDMVLPYAWVYYELKTGNICRIEHFGEIKRDNNTIRLTDGDRSRESSGGFLYDGVDTYIFLERVTVTAGEETVELPSMSYAVARYGNTLQYYADSLGKSTVVETGENNQLAAFGNGDVLNMGTDTLYCANGTWQLLIVSPQVLERID